MHYCAPFSRSQKDPRDATGCPANGVHHPAGHAWLCLFCDIVMPDQEEVA